MRTDLTSRHCARAQIEAIRTVMTSHAIRKPQPRPEILAIDPYVPGKSHVAGVDKVHKLSSNESPLGPSRKAVEAVRALADRLELYPDGASTALREAIGRRYGLDPARIICGNGSDELLALLAHVFLHPGEEGLYSQYGFLTYPICIRAAGGIPVVAEETDRTASVDAILAKVSARTKIVYLANPNNPTGTYIPYSEVQAPARRPAAACASGDRRGLRRICDPQRLRGRRRIGCGGGQRRHDPDFLQDPWAREFAHRLGLWFGACHRRAQSSARTLQPQRGGAGRGRREPRRRRAYRRRDRAQCALADLACRADHRARRRGDAERRKFSAADLP